VDSLLLATLLSPLLIAAGTAAQRRFGPRVGGLVVGLPLTSVPLLAVIAITHGTSFAAETATASLEGTVAQAALVWVWAYAVLRWGRGALVGTAAGVAAFGGFVVLADQVPTWPALLGGVAGTAACAAALRWWPRPADPSPRTAETAGLGGRHRLGLRMAAAGIFAFVVDELAGLLGAHLAGLVTALPLLTLLMGALTHREDGREAAVAFLHGVTRGSFSVVTALLALAVTLPDGHPGVAFAVAVVTALATQAALQWGAPGRDRVPVRSAAQPADASGCPWD
jgi:hypothetical protein